MRGPYSLRNVQEFVPDVAVRLFPDSALALPVEIDSPSPGVEALFKQLGQSDFFCFDPGPMTIDYRFGKRSSLFRMITEVKKLGASSSDGCERSFGSIDAEQLAADTDSVYLAAAAELSRPDGCARAREIPNQRTESQLTSWGARGLPRHRHRQHLAQGSWCL